MSGVGRKEIGQTKPSLAGQCERMNGVGRHAIRRVRTSSVVIESIRAAQPLALVSFERLSMDVRHAKHHTTFSISLLGKRFLAFGHLP